jgi:hypothetical protein
VLGGGAGDVDEGLDVGDPVGGRDLRHCRRELRAAASALRSRFQSGFRVLLVAGGTGRREEGCSGGVGGAAGGSSDSAGSRRRGGLRRRGSE